MPVRPGAGAASVAALPGPEISGRTRAAAGGYWRRHMNAKIAKLVLACVICIGLITLVVVIAQRLWRR